MFNIEKTEITVTGVECLIARTGTVIVSSAIHDSRLNACPDIHIIVAYSSQLVDYMNDVLVKLQNKYKDGLPSSVHFITGSSRTADIEKTLIIGTHEPKQLWVYIISLYF